MEDYFRRSQLAFWLLIVPLFMLMHSPGSFLVSGKEVKALPKPFAQTSSITAVHATPIPTVIVTPRPPVATPVVRVVVVAQPVITASHDDWMRAAGIAPSDWWAVDYIVSRESGWNPGAVNKSSGACSLVQALPCSKLGPNWDDPVVALRWQLQYVTQRYGGYPQAVSWWSSHHWY